MKVKAEHIRHPIRALKTAPVGFSLATFGGVLFAGASHETFDNPHLFINVTSLGQTAIDAAIVLVGYGSIKKTISAARTARAVI